ncbi:MAG: hypothetical protein AB1473_11415 [Thermodesulfobacteriota bacterium]
MITKVAIGIAILVVAAGAFQLADAYTVYKGTITTYELRGSGASGSAPYSSCSAGQPTPYAQPSTCAPPACPPPGAQYAPPPMQYGAPAYNMMPMQYYQPPQSLGKPMWR